ncbi:hypothetical protein NX059_006564 [Plenodomus lindquistii]|nr:hypothetical protein NX059_006564 [Plenodomus lindquistii]
MSQTAEGYFNALVALTGNTALRHARQNLITKISDKELVETAVHAIKASVPREDLQAIVLTIFDKIAATKGTTAPAAATTAEQSCDTPRNTPAPTGFNSPTTPLSKVLPKFDTEETPKPIHSPRKRGRSSETFAPHKRQKNSVHVHSDSTDSRTPLLRSRQEKSANRDEIIFGRGGDDAPNPDGRKWSEIQWISLMIKIHAIGRKKLHGHANENALDLSKTALIVPDVKIVLAIPIGAQGTEGFMMRDFNNLDVSLVVSIVEKFNIDFLRTQEHRKRYCNLLKELSRSVSYDSCIREYVHYTKSERSKRGHTDWGQACSTCTSSGMLCLRVREWSGKPTLVLFPIRGKRLESLSSVSTMDYWVRK